MKLLPRFLWISLPALLVLAPWGRTQDSSGSLWIGATYSAAITEGLTTGMSEASATRLETAGTADAATSTGAAVTLVGALSSGDLFRGINSIVGGATLSLGTEAGIGLVKSSGGTLVLGSVNTYTGSTIINGGTLVLGSGNTYTGGTIINDSTGLSLSAGVGGVIASGGTLSLGNGVSGGTVTWVSLQQGNTLTINSAIIRSANTGNIENASGLMAAPLVPEPSVSALLVCGLALAWRRTRSQSLAHSTGGD